MAGASENVQQGVVDANFKNIAESGAIVGMLAAYDSVAHQRAMNKITELGFLSGARKYSELDIQEAASEVKAGEAGDLANALAELNAAVAAIQTAIKGAQTTPPVTA